MPISKDKLQSILSRNSEAMQNPEWDTLVEDSRPDAGGFADLFQRDDMYSNSAPAFNSPRRGKVSLAYNDEMVQNSKLPEAIKKSLMEKKIDVGDMDGSVLDSMNVASSPRKSRQAVNEQVSARQSVSSPVDYTIIKAIVNECLKEYFSSQPVNESASLQTIGLKDGNITLVDNKGNVFQAKLQKIGNKNDHQ